MNKEIKLTEVQQKKFNKFQILKNQLNSELQKVAEQEQDILDIIFEINEIDINVVESVEFVKDLIKIKIKK